MIRKFIPLDSIKIYDEMHILQPDGTFIVDEARDGKSTEDHIKGIEYIKKVLQDGAKIMPVLVLEESEGEYIRLDGFKRCLAQQQLGYKYIEAYVCTPEEYRNATWFESGMRAWKGGQFKEVFPLFEGGETAETDYNNTTFLYKDDSKPHGLRIELAECVHVHWGECGKYRLGLGEEDFLELAKAITSWEK